MKKEIKKPVKKEMKKIRNVHAELDYEVFLKLKNTSDITGLSYKQIFDQALRGLLKMATPTLEEQIKSIEGEE